MDSPLYRDRGDMRSVFRIRRSGRPTDIPPIAQRIAPRLHNMLGTDSQNPIKIWVYFTDKGISTTLAYRNAVSDHERSLTKTARRRRSLRKDGEITDMYDLPVYPSYVEQIVSAGALLLGRSRWLNAISVSATPEVVRRLATLPFVQSIEPVAVYRRSLPEPSPPDIALRPLTSTSPHALNYGASLIQLAQIQVPQLHDLGLSGKGVTVALFDTGFHLGHTAFDSLRSRIVGERDFINGDTHTADDPAQDFFAGQHDHGTQTLSATGAYAPGQLIGPAYGARFILAKTESIAFERQVEEDWWMQAMEWADSLGADIISSSLGYNSWYSYEDMDGQTAVTTKAAKIAASRGIVVVNAMGNEGQSFWQTLIAPADADSIVSVGAVDSTGTLANFSSRGPTADGRIKPDVVAMGVSVRLVVPGSADQYTRNNGTSFSTPLVAGTVALLLEAYPSWTPFRTIQALRSTGSRSATPDTLFGYGIVRALGALLTEATVQVSSFVAANDAEGVLLSWNAAPEINIAGWRLYRKGPIGGETLLNPTPIPARGNGAFGFSRTYLFVDTTAVEGLTYEYALEAVAFNGLPLTASRPQSQITVIPTDSTGLPPFTLHQNQPNPFNPSTEIVFDIRQTGRVRLVVYNAIGQQIKTLVDEVLAPGRFGKTWDATDTSGRPVASGVYFYRLSTQSFLDVKKMVLIR